MAQQSMLMGLLKTPSQVRQEQQEKLAQDAFARSQQMITGGGTTALPGILSRYGAQAAQRGAMAGAGLLRGVTGGLGQAVGGDMGQRIADLGVTAEERQARSAQDVVKNIDPNDSESLMAAAEQLQLINPRAALALKEKAKQVKVDAFNAEYKQKQLQKLEAEIAKLNNPSSFSFKEKAQLTKDFTPESIKAAVAANDISLLDEKSNPSGKYVVMQRTKGVDRNGQPIIEEILVDKDQVAALTGSSPVVTLDELEGFTAPSPEKKEKQEAAKKASTDAETTPTSQQTDIPGVSGLSVEKNIDFRRQALSDIKSATDLITDVFDPSFEDVTGRVNIVARQAAITTGSDLAPLVSRIDKGAKTRAIAAVKQLGVNPTDTDLQLTLDSAPTPNDPPNVWRDWVENKFIPDLFIQLDAQIGPNDPKVKEVKKELQAQLEASKTSPSTDVRTTSSGTKYTIKRTK